MMVVNPFDWLPDKPEIDGFITVAKRPDFLKQSGLLLCKYRRDLMEGMSGKFQDPYYNSRIYSAGLHVFPFLTESIDAKPLRALEIGSGEGLHSAMLSHAFSEYVGIEIQEKSVAKAEYFCRKFGCSNVHFFHDEAANIENFFARQNVSFDVIILHAVLEHLLPEERVSTLQCCWEHLHRDGYLFIGHAPSSIFPEDRHSSFLPYFQQMQIDLWPHFYQSSHAEHWRRAMHRAISNGSLVKTAYRQGVSVGYREFEKGFRLSSIDILRNHTVSDNYNVFLMNRIGGYSIFDFLKLSEMRQFQQYRNKSNMYNLDLPDVLSRHYLEILLQKSYNDKVPSD